MGIPQNGWSIMGHLAKMNDLGYPYFRKPHETYGNVVLLLEAKPSEAPPSALLSNQLMQLGEC